MSTPVAISGSRSAAILGVSDYSSTVQVWLEIMETRDPGFCERNNYKYEKFEDNDQTAFGSAFEDAICEIVGGITDREKYYEDGYLTCHIDGLKFIGTEYPDGRKFIELVLVENKTTSAQYFYSSFSEKLNRIPIGYMCQIQHNLYLTGLDKCMMNVLVFPKTVDQIIVETSLENIDCMKWTQVLKELGYLKTFIIERDDELIKMMLDEYSTFWNKNILGGIMPDLQTLNDFKSIYTNPKGTVIATEQVERWDAERKQLMAEKKDIDKRIDQIKLLLCDYMRKADSVIDDETREKTFLMSRDGRKLLQYDGGVVR